uniref:Non-homologous end-joining factor 1 n=1 Tax=Anopheles dirus TaxID=7168 RepID=A0A182NWC0_9DIPT
MSDFCELPLRTKGFYGVDFSKTLDKIKCIVFNMEGIWMEELSTADLIKRQQERNPSLECTEALIDQTLLAGGDASYSVDLVGDCVHFTVKYYLENYPVSFLFLLWQGSVQEVSCHYIKPLWRTLLRQEAEIRALVEELKRKDVEIAQYQAEGARLNRTAVQTAPFEVERFEREIPVQLPRQIVNVRNLLSSNVHRGCLMKTLDITQRAENTSPAAGAKRPSVPTVQQRSHSNRRKKRARQVVTCVDTARSSIAYDNEQEECE